MSGPRPPHLHRRNGVYHLRMRVPDRLQARIERVEVWKSLRTYSLHEARHLAAKVSANVLETFAVIEKNTNISSDEARALIQACYAAICRVERERGPYNPTTSLPDLELVEQEVLANDEITRLRGQLESAVFSPDVLTASIGLLIAQGVDMGTVSQTGQAMLVHGAVRALVERQRLFVARLRDPLAVYVPADPLFSAIAVSSSPATQPEAVTGITVGHAVEEYLSTMEGRWTEKTTRARKVQLAYLADHLGAGRPLAAVTADDVRGYRNALTKLRANHGRRQHLPFHERLTENAPHQIKNKTASLIYESAKAFFRWAKEEEGAITSNPAADVRWQAVKAPKAQRSRRPFSKEELLTLFGSTVFTGCKSKHRRFEPGPHVIKDDRYWIVILGYYTGARLGEIVQLHLDDVVLDHEVPHLDLNENSGKGDPKHIKTDAGVRQIPIHQDVLDLGLAEFVAKRRKWDRPSRRLFSEITLGADGQASTQFSKMFARVLDQIGLTDPALTFHSFRHGLEDAQRNAGLPQYTIDSIMGHSDGRVSSMYGEGPSLQAKCAAIQSMCLPVRVDGLLLGKEGA
ncbi:tyrosine-type recombinase/integrase [Altererythrobacter salegens]|uniref:Tyrosine-type recombinase/integrase n=1 Tax=Croceibacterium salegens TaxID=1737568 RepID=A0A6I4SRV6_9SPHN|nr:tyrosine-type recombinase/integrase [Croceibacterium salegens]